MIYINSILFTLNFGLFAIKVFWNVWSFKITSFSIHSISLRNKRKTLKTFRWNHKPFFIILFEKYPVIFISYYPTKNCASVQEIPGLSPGCSQFLRIIMYVSLYRHYKEGDTAFSKRKHSLTVWTDIAKSSFYFKVQQMIWLPFESN